MRAPQRQEILCIRLELLVSNAICPGLAASGFLGPCRQGAIPFEDKKAIEDVACYIVRNPLSLKTLFEKPGVDAVDHELRADDQIHQSTRCIEIAVCCQGH